MRKRLKHPKVSRLGALLFLGLTLFFVGTVTAAATVSSYEVILGKDTKFSSAITGVELTTDQPLNDSFIKAHATTYSQGDFGVPAKIRFPETRTHIDILPAAYESGQWKANAGKAHFFLAQPPAQKVFGQALIYLRTQTATTHNLGRVISGDIVNVITTDGWQLGYQVKEVSGSAADVLIPSNQTSQIVVVMIDDLTGLQSYFSAELTKVGGRL